MANSNDDKSAGLPQYPLSHERGYFVAPRSLDELEPLCQKPLALAVYVMLSCRVRSTPGWAQGSHGAEFLNRGQCLAGENELARKLNVNPSAVRRTLGLLARLGLICRKAKKRGSIVTFLRYGEFGLEPSESEEATTKRRSATDAATKRTRCSDDEVAKPNERLTVNEKRSTDDGDQGIATPLASRASQAGQGPRSPKRNEPKPNTDHQTFITAFTELFKVANDGNSPSWGGKQGAIVKRMLKDHGLEACLTRAKNMFVAPPGWPPPPHDLATLSLHFDKFAVPHKSKGSVGHYNHTGSELYGTGEIKI